MKRIYLEPPDVVNIKDVPARTLIIAFNEDNVAVGAIVNSKNKWYIQSGSIIISRGFILRNDLIEAYITEGYNFKIF